MIYSIRYLHPERGGNTMEHAAIREEGNFMVMKGGKSYTIADIEALPEDQHAELIDGELFMMATPSSTHQEILVIFFLRLKGISEKTGENVRCIPLPMGCISRMMTDTLWSRISLSFVIKKK